MQGELDDFNLFGSDLVKNLRREMNCHASFQEFARSWVPWAERLRTFTGAMSEKPGGKNSAVVEYQDIAGVQMLGEIPELIISKCPGAPVQHEHSRSRPIRERLLCDEFFRKMKIEVGDEHVSSILIPGERAFHHKDAFLRLLALHFSK